MPLRRCCPAPPFAQPPARQVTGGANVPALNDLLAPFGIAIGGKVYNGDAPVHDSTIASGNAITQFPVGGYLMSAGLHDAAATSGRWTPTVDLPVLGLLKVRPPPCAVCPCLRDAQSVGVIGPNLGAHLRTVPTRNRCRLPTPAGLAVLSPGFHSRGPGIEPWGRHAYSTGAGAKPKVPRTARESARRSWVRARSLTPLVGRPPRAAARARVVDMGLVHRKTAPRAPRGSTALAKRDGHVFPSFSGLPVCRAECTVPRARARVEGKNG